jgi:hypothetical protein
LGVGVNQRSMAAINPQELREVEVFTSFSNARINTTFDAIEKRNPPEPDIRCEIRHQGPVAFELVEIIDEAQVARNQGIQLDVMETFREKFNEMSQAHQHRLRELIGNTTVRVRMNPAVSVQRRRAAIPGILADLLNIERQFEGEYVLPADLRTLASLTIVRGNFDGPRFTAMHGAHYNPIPTTGLERKLNRAYQSDAPMELLAYFDTQHAPLPEAIARLRTFVESRIAASAFEQVWIYDVTNARVIDVIKATLV